MPLYLKLLQSYYKNFVFHCDIKTQWKTKNIKNLIKINLNKAVSLIFELLGIGNMQQVQNQKEPDHKNQTLHL